MTKTKLVLPEIDIDVLEITVYGIGFNLIRESDARRIDAEQIENIQLEIDEYTPISDSLFDSESIGEIENYLIDCGLV